MTEFENRSSHRRGRGAGGVVIAAALLAGLVSVVGPAGVAAAVEQPQYGSSAQAVAAGVLDLSLAKDVARGATRTALVTHRQGDALAAAAEVPDRDVAKKADVIAEKLDAKKDALDTSPEATIVARFEHVPTTVVEVSSVEALMDLVNSQGVASVTPSQEFERAALDSQSARLVRQPQSSAVGYTGAGTYVAVFDTGLDYRHPDFGNCTSNFTPASCRAGSYEVAPNDGSLDAHSHGTNVSAIVAGMGPSTRVLGLDVFNGETTNSTFVLRAVEQVVAWKVQGYNIVAVNMSIGSGKFTGSCSDTHGIATLRAAGIIPVIASGNETYTNATSAPACAPGALSVGAVYDADYGRVAHQNCTDVRSGANRPVCFSNSGPGLQMLAPGFQITAGGYTKSGTSMAAPHVAGAVAVLAAAKPYASIGQLQAALTGSGPVVTDRDGRQRHSLDLYAALALLLSTDRTPPTVATPHHEPMLGGTASKSRVPFTYGWSATDTSGVNAYEVYTQVDGAAFTRVTVAPTATAVNLYLRVNHTYRLAVRARDRVGNWSAWKYGPSFRVASFSESSRYVKYSSGWSKVRSSKAIGGQVRATSRRSARASFTFTGSSLAWIATKASNRGKATVYLDGVKQGTWNLRSRKTRARTIVLNYRAASVGTHTLRIVRKQAPRRGAIDLDSFVITG